MDPILQYKDARYHQLDWDCNAFPQLVYRFRSLYCRRVRTVVGNTFTCAWLGSFLGASTRALRSEVTTAVVMVGVLVYTQFPENIGRMRHDQQAAGQRRETPLLSDCVLRPNCVALVLRRLVSAKRRQGAQARGGRSPRGNE